MKQLLVFTENYVRGGGNRYMVDLINAIGGDYDEISIRSNSGGVFSEDLQRLEYSVEYCHIFFLKGIDVSSTLHNFPRFIRRWVTLFLMAMEPLMLFLNIFIFMLAIYRIKPSKIISCNGGYPAARACLALVIASSILRVPAVLSIVSMPSKRNPYMRIYEEFIDKLVWKSVSIVIVNAKAIATALHDYRGLLVKKIEVIFNGVENRQFSFLKSDKKDFVIGCVARMDYSKGVLVLLEAFAQLSKIYDHLILVLVGEGNASQALSRRTVELGLQNKVKLVGYYEGDIYELLKGLDIYVFPSFWEGLPYSIIEAMCSARTIIATKVGGIPEIINNGIEGVLITPNSVIEMIRAIDNLVGNEKLRYKLAVNAYKKFQRELTLQKMKIQIRQVLSI